ncbi:hypothetical protein KCV87_09360 [Actinosynnema pretiosum subsp. pretiosum]|uniref:Uncharacterized protein n=1 Tax=Actinosynnema pretiosum subsp. pretiosum TaxID=103721 RepID=A0AA45LAJ5_9PSEU|nr:hypothetical protein APASM_2163 [Actinosynnema pretiosum subsp. pretiosum]QUF06237.1 hypothetical protein KCV87_09360 [Actinosynnema pretiosum subsp. pretiosum]
MPAAPRRDRLVDAAFPALAAAYALHHRTQLTDLPPPLLRVDPELAPAESVVLSVVLYAGVTGWGASVRAHRQPVGSLRERAERADAVAVGHPAAHRTWWTPTPDRAGSGRGGRWTGSAGGSWRGTPTWPGLAWPQTS